MKFPRFLIVSVALIAIMLGLMQLRRVRLPVEGSMAASDGVFVGNGSVPEGHDTGDAKIYWSSWAGSNSNRGVLTVGPFAAPKHLRLEVMGYPGRPGNSIRLVDAASKAVLVLPCKDTPAGFRSFLFDLPDEWLGRIVSLLIEDGSVEASGWMVFGGVYEVPGWARWWMAPASRLCEFLAIGAVLFIFLRGTSIVCERLGLVHPSLILLCSCGLTALAGYLVFWLMFASATVGAICAFGALIAAAISIWKWENDSSTVSLCRSRDWRLPALAMALTGIIYVAGLFCADNDLRTSEIAQLRFTNRLPSDNILPQLFAERFTTGVSARPFLSDWQGSDRPPLQAGWILLLNPVTRLMGIDFDTAAQFSGIWFQLIWIPAAWGLMRCLGASTGAAIAVIAAIVPTGFLFLNSVFVWPKLAGGAFLVGSFLTWFGLPSGPTAERRTFAAGGLLAALAWLSHGGVAFALVGLAPFVLWSLSKKRFVQWGSAAAVFLLCVGPWSCYRKFYDPPGNRLVKWHIGGAIAPDDRGTLETITDSYQSLTFEEIVSTRRQNFVMTLAGDWKSLRNFNFASPQERRNSESFLFLAAGWWNLGFMALALPFLVPFLRKRWTKGSLRFALLATAWFFSTVVAWVLLMFFPNTVFIQSGSYSTLVVLLPILALSLWRLHPAIFSAVTLAQVCTFVFVWFEKPTHLETWPTNSTALIVAGLSYVFLWLATAHAFAKPQNAIAVRSP